MRTFVLTVDRTHSCRRRYLHVLQTQRLRITEWLYRPGLGWERRIRHVTQADIAAASGTPMLLEDDPALVPLETLPGRNHYDFPAAERPPWQWRIAGRYPGWSS
jgi:hypothetical protein